MVDIARYFLQFTQDQSCGKCTFCRIGTKRMLDILNPTQNTVDTLMRLDLPAGVDVEIKVFSRQGNR